jgi:hypothetical protein
MNNIALGFVIAASVAGFGCKKSGGDCAKAIAHSMELSKADMAKMGVDDKMMAQMASLGVQHCKDDKWPDEAITCMLDAKAIADAQACYGKLSQDQRDKMNKAAMELKPTTPAGSAAGSAVEGAGSGSAAMTGSAEGSGSAAAGSGSAAAGSAADAGSARDWNCKHACKLAVDCKSKKAQYHDVKECETDCTNLAKDTNGRYERGSVMGPSFYSCIDKATDCAGIKTCDK